MNERAGLICASTGESVAHLDWLLDHLTVEHAEALSPVIGALTDRVLAGG